MKKISLFFILCAVFIFSGSAECGESPSLFLFITVLQEPQVLSSRQEINKLLDFANKNHIKTLFVQIYRANQAWFPSKIADSTAYKTCLKNISEDPLRLLIRQAHKSGIQVHAWLNLLSLSTNKNAIILKKYGRDILTKNLKKKKSLEDYKIDKQYFLEPGDLRVHSELSNMVGEILNNYPELDGILFDYIRYPDQNPAYGYTKININRFKKATGLKTIEENSKTWKDWKRAQVTELLKQLVKKIRSIRPNIQIAATGCSPLSRAYHEAFQDWPSWIELDLVDFVTIMSYSIDNSEFEKYILEAKAKIADFKKVNIAIGAYELGDSPKEFTQQLKSCKNSGSNACVIFHYGSLINNSVLSNCLTNEDKSQ